MRDPYLIITRTNQKTGQMESTVYKRVLFWRREMKVFRQLAEQIAAAVEYVRALQGRA